MNDKKRIIRGILIDIIMVTIIIVSVYVMLAKKVSAVTYNICAALVVVSIPVIFVVSFITFSWEKYDEDPCDEDNEGDEENIL